MYKNIGGKIKGLAKAYFIVGAIFCVLCGVIAIGVGVLCLTQIVSSDAELKKAFEIYEELVASYEGYDFLVSFGNIREFKEVVTAFSLLACISGVGTIVVGGLVSWISSWLMYGFGELIVKVTAIEAKTRYMRISSNT